MNIFDNLIQSSTNQFLGNKVQPQPSFATPQAPRTSSYVAPNVPYTPVQTKQPVLFANEKTTYQKMLSDGVSEQEAQKLVKQHRDSLYQTKDLTPNEMTTLRKMASDGLTSYEAIDLFKKHREQKAKEGNQIQDMHKDEGVVEQTLKAPFRAIGDVASQTWQGIGKGTEGLLDASFRGVNDLNRMIGSSDYSPELEKQLPQGGYLGDVAKIGAGTTGAVFNLGKAPLALGINTANQLPGAQYITQGIGKGIQYGAENLGEMTGVDKETSMDLATTGMNLFGMKTGMNTLQYGRGIVNAPGVMGKAGAIVKPVGESVVQTVKMPYDIAKGTYNLAKKLPNPLPKGADVSTRANRFNAGDEGKFIEQIKETPGQFATSRGMTEVGEKAIEKAQQNFERSKLEADTSFDAIQGKFSTKGSNNDIVGDILKANKEKMDAQPRNKDRVRVDELFAKYESNEGLSMSEINEAKRIHARNHTYSYEQRTSNEARNASDIQNDIRDWQFQTAKENGFTNADKVNMETKGWKMFADSLAKKMDRSGANNAIGITDWIALSGGNPTNVALFLGKKAASSNLVKTGAIKLLSKQTKPSIIKGTKADIQQANFEKNVNRGISSDRNSVGGDSMVTPAGLIEAPTGQATGAKNFRVNQPAEKTPIKNEGQVGVRPGSKSQAQIKEEVQLAKQATRQSELKLITDDIASATERARYGGTGNTRIETQLNGKMDAGKLTREEAIDIATEILQDVQKKGISSKYKYIDRPKLEEYINDLYSNKKMPTFDDLLNESKPIIIPPSNAKQSLIKPKSTTTNVFGETIDKPSNKKGGFIKMPEIGKKYSPEGAIRTYTNSSDKINKMLREGKEYPQIEALDKFLTEAKKYDGTVYRGLTVDEGKYNSILENIRKNGIKDKAYTSTTENYGDATTYSRNSKVDGKKGIMFEIESKNGRVIDKKYNAYNEEEILFPRNTQFEYVGEYNDAGRGLIIKLKEKSKSIPVKNPLVEEAKVKPKKAKK